MSTISLPLAFATLMMLSAPLHAQQRNAPPEDPAPVVVDVQAARTADVGGGRIGQRQTREDAARTVGAEPMARINNRIANRVQSRLRNRIDRNYDPRANTATPFTIADDQLRAAGGPRRR